MVFDVEEEEDEPYSWKAWFTSSMLMLDLVRLTLRDFFREVPPCEDFVLLPTRSE